MFDNVETRVTDRFDEVRRRLHYVSGRRQVSLEATFLGAVELRSLDVPGPCSPPLSDTLRLNNFSQRSNQRASHLVGEIWGCTRHTFVGQYPVENTASRFSMLMRYVYIVPAAVLFPGGAVRPSNYYLLRTSERLRGVVTLKSRRTFNSWWVEHEDSDFGASVSIRREVRVFDTVLPPAEPVLTISETIYSDSLLGNDKDMDELEYGESVQLSARDISRPIDQQGYVSEFAGVGGNLVIDISYRFGAFAKGQGNIVKFAGPARRPEIPEGFGPFVIRNDGVILETEFEEPLRIR